MLNENYLYMCMLYKLGTIAPSVVVLSTVLIIFVPIWLFAPSEEDIKAYKEHLISENKLYSK